MSEFLGYNANRGTWYTYKEEDGRGYVTIKQDHQPILDYAKELRNSGVNDKVGDFSHYAIIPAELEVELRRRGINLYDPNCNKDVIKVIEREYPKYKVSNLRHAIK